MELAMAGPNLASGGALQAVLAGYEAARCCPCFHWGRLAVKQHAAVPVFTWVGLL